VRIITLLNQVYYLKSFIYKNDQIEEVQGMKAFVVDVVPRKNSKAVCPSCKLHCPTYDHQRRTRLYEFIPIWGMKVYLRYRSRRSVCSLCGVHVELIPWAEGKHHSTKAFQIFLARWARRLSWKETAEVFQTSWDNVFRSVKSIVSYGLKHRKLDNIRAIGVDEWQYNTGHKYVTLVYQIDINSKRLLFIAKNRTKESLNQFFNEFGKERTNKIKYICSDMWKQYLTVIAEREPHKH
jgi:transposase